MGRKLLTSALLLLSLTGSASQEIALVLSGGGARGAYEIGVWKGLQDLGFEIGGVYGTSVGAINGAAVAMEDFELARDLWLDLTYDEVMSVSPQIKALIEKNFTKLSLTDFASSFRKVMAERGIDITPLRRKLDTVISEEKIRNSKVDYGLVAYSVSNLKPRMFYKEDIKEGQLLDYILASANFPVFQREYIGGESFVDGGVYNNIPIEMAKNKGFKTAVIVDIGTYGVLDIQNVANKFKNYSIDVIYIKPSQHFGSVLNFDPEISRKYLLEGYLDTMREYGVLQGDSYYIYGPEDIIGKLFTNLSQPKRREAIKVLGEKYIEGTSTEFQYYRQILPVLETAARVKIVDPNYSCPKLLEDLAKSLGINWLEIYSPYELLGEIIKANSNPSLDNNITELLNSMKYGKILDFLSVVWSGHSQNPPEQKKQYIELKKQFTDLTDDIPPVQ